ncbi:hypothetical protein HRG_007621 [Hirsutella rhossiliensis]|uniref:DUF2293 domain-containing protein n=1 Tax=Hirsutella rhossiliensis TaxID=111463 RepID=A0A9P8MSW7_9HYPO|nr:uncharacterized protein HRG_07621 [Hirsutella rhossiliensis]KAH0961543.1 hypothetical protein HRG_07621 [Hirsutella rhossiliensis]
MAREEVISPEAPKPRGYGFLKKGNPFMTALCRRKTSAAGKKLYVVSSRGVSSGLLAPEGILAEVIAEELETRGKRSAAVEKRDGAVRDDFEQAILRLYPKIPLEEVAKISSRTLEKRSRRVGRTGRLDLVTKVRLAVAAHVRHCHTDYDKIVRGCNIKWTARQSIHDEASRVLASWGGPPPPPPSARSKEKRGIRQASVDASEPAAAQRKRHQSPTARPKAGRRLRQASVDLDELAASRRERKRLARRVRKARKREVQRAQMAQAGGTLSGPLTRGRAAALQRDRPGSVPHEVIEIIDSSENSGEETAEPDAQEASGDARHDSDLEVIVIEDSDED